MKVYTEMPQTLLIPLQVKNEESFLSFSFEKPVAVVKSNKKEDKIQASISCPCDTEIKMLINELPTKFKENTIFTIEKKNTKRCLNDLHCKIALFINLYHQYTGKIVNTMTLPLPPEKLIVIQHLHYGGIQYHIIAKNKPILMHYFLPTENLKIILIKTLQTKNQQPKKILSNHRTLYNIFKGFALAQKGLAEESINSLLKASKELLKENEYKVESEEIPLFPTGVEGQFILLSPVSNACSEKISELNTRVADYLKKITGLKILTRISRGGVLVIE